MGKFQVERKHSNIGLFVVIAVAYVALLVLFGWQTWEFVNFLFPDDQVLMKILTLFCFDIMALIWGCTHIFYRFAHPTAKSAVIWGWAITNLLSLIATVIYMIIQSMFRFRLTISQDLVNIGYGVTIAALVFNIAMIAVFLYKEIGTRFPNEDEFELVEKPKKHQSPVQTASLPQQSSADVPQQPVIDRKAGWTPEDYQAKLEQLSRDNARLQVALEQQQASPNGHAANDAFPGSQQK